MHVQRAGEARRVPWKNGLGTTTELAVWPAGSGFDREDFGWRISAARVEVDGPFSRFDGCDRILVVTAGAGLVLDHGDVAPTATVAPMRPYTFSGAWPTTARLCAGPVVDLNLIHRRGVVAELVAVAGEGGTSVEPVDRAHLFVHVLRGPLRVRQAADTAQLGSGDSVWLRGPAQPVELAPSQCAYIVARIGEALSPAPARR